MKCAAFFKINSLIKVRRLHHGPLSLYQLELGEIRFLTPPRQSYWKIISPSLQGAAYRIGLSVSVSVFLMQRFVMFDLVLPNRSSSLCNSSLDGVSAGRGVSPSTVATRNENWGRVADRLSRDFCIRCIWPIFCCNWPTENRCQLDERIRVGDGRVGQMPLQHRIKYFSA